MKSDQYSEHAVNTTKTVTGSIPVDTTENETVMKTFFLTVSFLSSKVCSGENFGRFFFMVYGKKFHNSSTM